MLPTDITPRNRVPVERRPFGPTISEPAAALRDSAARIRCGLLVTAAVAVPLLGGCGAPPVPQWKEGRAVRVAPSPRGSEAASPAAADAFAAAVRGRLPMVALDRRPEEITELGDAACAEMTGGERRGTAVDSVIGYGVSSPDAREVVRLARRFLCPS
ncbi:DUF732 domain-containing protein [Actinoplanes sp. NPDC051861]|uniref:DUF732 domain-containing protein n=1 Tax=Actinoplanes sp. NPDC051861 TaxID=3155170 RepID=UPI00343DB944